METECLVGWPYPGTVGGEMPPAVDVGGLGFEEVWDDGLRLCVHSLHQLVVAQMRHGRRIGDLDLDDGNVASS